VEKNSKLFIIRAVPKLQLLEQAHNKEPMELNED
jgi:hypothetical protein